MTERTSEAVIQPATEKIVNESFINVHPHGKGSNNPEKGQGPGTCCNPVLLEFVLPSQRPDDTTTASK